MGCQTTKIVEVPITKIEYVDRLVPSKDVPLCVIPYAKDTSVQEIVQLAQRQHTSLLKCNTIIDMYNKSK